MRTCNRESNNLKKIAELLLRADSVLIFPHIKIDGDALGSAAAICGSLNKIGKKAQIVIEEKIPDNIKFLDKNYCVQAPGLNDPDVCIAVDCSDISRLGTRKDYFKNSKNTASIDHHSTAVPFADFNYIDAEAAATGEIVLKLLNEMNYCIDAETAQQIYTAIVTDTGKFMYSNTTRETHLAVAELFKTGMDHNKVAIEVYQRKRIEKIKLMNTVIATAEMISDGKACIAYMTQQMLNDTGAYAEETEGIVEELRSVDGIEIAVFLKEEEDGVKVTMRSKELADVSQIAILFGGGGHKKAAGCTIKGTINEAKILIEQAINENLNSIEES